jgi:steroid 5-alpha reductase family enzyme
MTLLAQVLLAAAASFALMSALWVVAWRIRNWSLVDPGWALCLVVSATIYAATSDRAAAGPRLAAVVLAAVWGLRHAALLLAHRVIGHPEEGRYVELRTKWGPGAFFVFFWAQAALAVALSGPFLLACRSTETGFPVAAILLFVVGLIGESVADAQLGRWKRDPANRGRTCRSGLWSWSRHPNYFFEILIWCAFALLPAQDSAGWIVWYAPATLLALIVFVTGIGPSEAQALRTRGDEYRAYQATTSAFVPWPPRRPKR